MCPPKQALARHSVLHLSEIINAPISATLWNAEIKSSYNGKKVALTGSSYNGKKVAITGSSYNGKTPTRDTWQRQGRRYHKKDGVTVAWPDGNLETSPHM